MWELLARLKVISIWVFQVLLIDLKSHLKMWKFPDNFFRLSIFTHEIFFSFSNRSNKTFKPKKNIPEGTHQYDLMKHAAATLGSGNLRNAVQLPEGEDINEWIAVNSEYLNAHLPYGSPVNRINFIAVDFFNQINMLYGTITEFCTEDTCCIMSAGKILNQFLNRAKFNWIRFRSKIRVSLGWWSDSEKTNQM